MSHSSVDDCPFHNITIVFRMSLFKTRFVSPKAVPPSFSACFDKYKIYEEMWRTWNTCEELGRGIKNITKCGTNDISYCHVVSSLYMCFFPRISSCHLSCQKRKPRNMSACRGHLDWAIHAKCKQLLAIFVSFEWVYGIYRPGSVEDES